MKSKENLVFLGMMGSGKSSIGFLVAKKLKLNFVDIDKEIEKNLNITIKKIFEIKGEDYFRKIEEQTTLKILKLNSTVISLGGGAFMNKNISKEILKKHLSKLIEFDLKIFDTLEVKFDPIIIGYFSVLVTIFNLVCFINFYNFIYYFTFSKIITLYFI